ncbi:MAG: Trehalose utilization, partial [Prosthecobacter sp.]|nr:Trehalose utilization [Prosthecobacter sp.]
KDGTVIRNRGGGIVRIRPDGTGLEIVSQGQRNILDVAVSPTMDIFTRDNTNDGGGWNVRFHHFTGLDDHGYPRLYKNFNDECIQPLADYGGGSGCGAVYIDEPGFGKWNNAPFTCDWGTSALWHHQVKPKGATFEETEKPQPFIQMTRPTDADVDGNSRVYCASWKGATFNWEGPDVGYIVQVKPKGFKPEPLPDFAKLNDKELVKQLESPSYRRRMDAQRQLQARSPEMKRAVEALTRDQFSKDTREREISRRLLTSPDAKEVRVWLMHPDAVVSHMATRLAGMNKMYPICFELIDESKGAAPKSAFRALAMMHQPEVVTGLIERLAKATDPALRQGILSALCRLHFHEGEWKGDSWGTRPDTRGPYYQPEAWSETPKIAAALKDALAKAAPEEAAFLVKEMNRNRIQSSDALERILVLAKQDAKVIPDAVAQLATAETIPGDAIPLLISAANSKQLDPQSAAATLANTLTAIAKTDNAEAWTAALNALISLDAQQGSGKEQEAGRTAFLNAPKLENVHQAFETEATKIGTPTAAWAEAALLSLAARKGGSPEAREMSQKALDAGWADAKRRFQIINTAVKIKSHVMDEKILAAISDSDPRVVNAAQNAVKSLKLVAKGEDKSPKIGSLKPEDALTAVLKTKGDIAIGEQIFTKATCIACHTTKETEAQKGPYLGNIAQTYKRPELAQNILDPNKTIAQGFASEVVTLNDGTQQLGFITFESADNVKLRNVAAQEFTFAVKDIKSRQKLPISIMPPGLMANFTVREFASLLTYLESLAKK